MKVTILSDTDPDGYLGACSLAKIFQSLGYVVTYVSCSSVEHEKRELLKTYNADIIITVDLSITPKMLANIQETIPLIIVIDHHISSAHVLDSQQFAQIFPSAELYNEVMTHKGVFEIGKNALMLLDHNYSASRTAEQLVQYMRHIDFFVNGLGNFTQWKAMMTNYLDTADQTFTMSDVSRVVDAYDRGKTDVRYFDPILYYLLTENFDLFKVSRIYNQCPDEHAAFVAATIAKYEIVEHIFNIAVKEISYRARAMIIKIDDQDLPVTLLRDSKQFRFHLALKLFALNKPVISYIYLQNNTYLLIIRTPFTGRLVNAYGLALHLTIAKNKCGGHFHASSCIVSAETFKSFRVAN
jgi:hypothetical protein